MYQEMHREFTRDTETLMDVGSAMPVAAKDEQMSFAWDRETRTDAVVAALRTVLDPEIPVNIYDLGLIYRIELGMRGTSRST